MNLKRLLATVSALVIVCGSMPVVQNHVSDMGVAVGAESFEEINDGGLTYHVFSDHAIVAR